MNQYKQQLRSRIRQQKRAMAAEDIQRRSELLQRMVLESEAYRNAKTIYGYLPFNQEVRTLPLLQQALSDGKQVALPKCTGTEMRFVLMNDLSRIRASAFGAPEPVDDLPAATDPHALVLVPGLAFDAAGHRMGYGGGFYDRFLARESTHPTIALCFDFQLLSRLETEPHDISVDAVFWV